MSKSIVETIQVEAMDDSVPLSSLLPKAYAVARKLELDEFANWANFELKGYECAAGELPDYRAPIAHLRGFNGRGWTPVVIPNDKYEKILSRAYCFESISQLEDTMSEMKGGIEICYYLNGEQARMVGQLVGYNTQYAHFLGRSAIMRIISTVRSSILDWAIELEMNGVKGEGISFTPREKEIAKVTTNNFHINGNVQGIVGNEVSENSISHLTMTVHQNDMDSLKKHLLEGGLTEDDVCELAEAIEMDATPVKEGEYGARVSAWMGKMITKAATGAWSIGVGTAGSFLGGALASYYGFS
ncbi:AbiTii domain-containing protein [Photobacterium atrarenae]|uniref:AbiTii domain-containing protein n=1 Tax=Photobacterium atrarenae TaxID=865757 RepID=A0ABY5GBB9_9GAMM|nr:hypothetical protein [Photobacterium atrarenae]UTV26369.1 hypothetical protein NNL38_08225 [Photobacterium atrarenae]